MAEDTELQGLVKNFLGGLLEWAGVEVGSGPSDPPEYAPGVEAAREIPVDIYAGGNNVTDQCVTHGYLRGYWLTLFFDAPKGVLDDEGAPLLLFPNDIIDVWRFGGFGNIERGICTLSCAELDMTFQGTAKWQANKVAMMVNTGLPKNEDEGFVFVAQDGVRPNGHAWPFELINGVSGYVKIMIP